MSFSHPIATSTFFGFAPRKDGTATTNESLIIPQWYVHYANGRLYFSETVRNIFVRTMTGALVSQFTGDFSEVSVQLSSGIYIIQTAGKSAKLIVKNGTGSSSARDAVETKVTIPSLTGLRSEKINNEYLNITANDSTFSVRIAYVEKFSFKTDNSFAFSLNNGVDMELSNYQGVNFSVDADNPANVIEIKYYQGSSGYVKFNYLNPFSISAYIDSRESYLQTIFCLNKNDGGQFYLDKIDSTRYLIQYKVDDSWAEFYLVPAIPAAVHPYYLDQRNIGKFTLVSARRDGDYLRITSDLSGFDLPNIPPVNLNNLNDYTFTFTYQQLTGGFTINPKLSSDVSKYGIVGPPFFADVNQFTLDIVLVGEGDPLVMRASFAIEKIKE